MSRDDANQAARNLKSDAGKPRDPDVAEVVEKLPDDVAPAEERGERIETGKAIATGGKSAGADDGAGDDGR